jgi:hypothetical protein
MCPYRDLWLLKLAATLTREERQATMPSEGWMFEPRTQSAELRSHGRKMSFSSRLGIVSRDTVAMRATRTSAQRVERHDAADQEREGVAVDVRMKADSGRYGVSVECARR